MSEKNIESIVEEDPKFREFFGSKLFIEDVAGSRFFSAKALKGDRIYSAKIEFTKMASNGKIVPITKFSSSTERVYDLAEADWTYLSENIEIENVALAKKRVGIYTRPSGKGEMSFVEYYVITKSGDLKYFDKQISGDSRYL